MHKSRLGVVVIDCRTDDLADAARFWSRALGAPVIPVLQGWTLDDYLACVDLYASAGVDLAAAMPRHPLHATHRLRQAAPVPLPR